MLIHPWDATVNDDEWRSWLADGREFGQLIARGMEEWPVVVPTHFLLEGQRVVLHLARPNPVWKALEADPRAVLSIIDDYAYIPTTWRAPADTPPEQGVPTSYYGAVQLHCAATIIDDPAEKADVLRRQLAALQPAGDYAQVDVVDGPYSRMLSGIRALALDIVNVKAKFKVDDHKPAEHRLAVAARLQQRGQGRDLPARALQLRRLDVNTTQPS
ncbi:FMN-binding negative transcriptional regulator [Nocardioides sp. J2M5]|uniref:FMN-binding negative transcriptional regulator n=1 Tax=Nocardioides palaemonis TaxID=2829810 RepID=UPI001BA7148E|nr:FMN-binding negative transcriptional regulator [Nocardioides palaemonis]MBS2936973.1 FMN-binding negative transcriptional regulator [Nocardioides palaemonis]